MDALSQWPRTDARISVDLIAELNRHNHYNICLRTGGAEVKYLSNSPATRAGFGLIIHKLIVRKGWILYIQRDGRPYILQEGICTYTGRKRSSCF